MSDRHNFLVLFAFVDIEVVALRNLVVLIFGQILPKSPLTSINRRSFTKIMTTFKQLHSYNILYCIKFDRLCANVK